MRDYHHRQFRLNGKAFTYDDLPEVAYSLVKEGEDYEKAIGDFLMDWISASPDVRLRTSGSTGPPKSISLKKEVLAESARATGAFFELGPGSRVLSCLPAETIAGKMMLVRAMLLGWNLITVRPASDPLAGLTRTYDFAAMVPLQLGNSLDKLRILRKCIVGGAPVPSGLLAALPEAGTEFWQTYGMTETASHIALRKLSPVPADSEPETVLPPFRTLEGITVTQDAQGCLVVHAPSRSQSPLTTRDVVTIESETAFRWVGRLDNAVNSGGVKLHPERLEARLSALLDCRFFLAGEPDPQLGERLVLVAETPSGGEELRRLVAETAVLSGYEKPRTVYTVDTFSETQGGKIDRQASLARARKAR